MPAFDPVRDAVLNSPIAQSHSLPSPRPQLDHPPASAYIISPISADSRQTVSPSLTRRATDLSVLLNSDSRDPSIRTPPPTRSSTLSHLLLPSDITDDKLSTVEPIQRSTNHDQHIAREDSPQRQTAKSSSNSRKLSNPSLFSPVLPSPVAGPSRLPIESPTTRSPVISVASRPSSSSSNLSLQTTVAPHTASSPMPPPQNPIPYNPLRRLTPARSVLIPMTPAEMETYRNYRGIGTQRLMKRKRERSEELNDDQPPAKKLAGDVGVVVDHYNARPDVGVVQRQESPIIGLKNFNNWVKSVLITSFAHPVLAAGLPSHAYSGPGRGGRGRNGGGSGKVLDMGCGKGGDLTKWAKARVREFFGVDIAAVSVDQARSRWETLRGPCFDASFAALDCYSEPLSKAFTPAQLAQPFDVVSMQFCMHYAFETLQKARCMLDNVSRWLRPGGVFVGTIPNAEQLLERLDALPPDAEDLCFGNNVYKIRFEDRKERPVFGHRYWFFLQDAVENVPEYIVRWDNFVELAAEYNLHPVYKKEFHDVFEEHQTHPEFGPLMVRMKVQDANGESAMDEDQWEAANIYIAFGFEKR